MATLPEEFDPKGPKLSRLPIRPAPPLRPRLFADEARFALRLSVLAGGAELAAWLWIAGGRGWIGAAVGALRLSRFVWASAGTRVSRSMIAFTLLFVALVAQGLSFPLVAAVAAGLCAPAELCATAAGDAITIERRAAAFAWLDMAQGVGVAAGAGLGFAFPGAVPAMAAAALLVSGIGVLDLRDRGTPRSAWPLAVYLSAARAPIAPPLCVAGFAVAASAVSAGRAAVGALTALVPFAGMMVAARLEPRLPNAVWLPRILALVAVAAALAPSGPLPAAIALAALGAAAAALPASVARAAAEMQRAATSGLVWSALALGAAFARAVL